MILQYKGFNENWCYTEAETIIWANVYVGDIIDKCHNTIIAVDALDYITKVHNEVDNYIKEQTGCDDEIIYISHKQFEEMKNVCVVMLDRKENPCTIVFDNVGVYILNNSGKTIQRVS